MVCCNTYIQPISRLLPSCQLLHALVVTTFVSDTQSTKQSLQHSVFRPHSFRSLLIAGRRYSHKTHFLDELALPAMHLLPFVSIALLTVPALAKPIGLRALFQRQYSNDSSPGITPTVTGTSSSAPTQAGISPACSKYYDAQPG